MVIRELLTVWGFEVDDGPLREANSVMKATAYSAGILAGVIGGVAVAVGKLANEYSNHEKTVIAFETMMGSVSEAHAMLDDLAKFAQKTPFDLVGVQQNAKQLMAMGIESEKVVDTMKMLGDVSAGVNVPLSRIAVNYGQIKSLGKAMTIDMKQFAMAGIPIYEELAKETGKSRAELMAMTSEGKITFEMVERAFKNMTGEGGKFNDLMFKQSATLGGMMSNLGDNLQQLQIKLGKFASQPLKDVLTAVNDFLDKNFDKIVVKVGKAVEFATKMLITFADVAWWVAQGIWTLIEAVGGLDKVLAILVATLTLVTTALAVFAFQKYYAGLLLMAKGVWALNAPLVIASAKILLMMGALALVVLAVEDFISFVRGDGSLLGDLLGQIFDTGTLDMFRQGFVLLGEVLMAIFVGLYDGFMASVGVFAPIFITTWDLIKKSISNSLEIFSVLYKWFMQKMGVDMVNVSFTVLDVFKKILHGLGALIGGIVGGIAMVIGTIISSIGMLLGALGKLGGNSIIKWLKKKAGFSDFFSSGNKGEDDLKSPMAGFMSDESFDSAVAMASNSPNGLATDASKNTSTNNKSATINGGVNVVVEGSNSTPEEIADATMTAFNDQLKNANADLEPNREN